MTLQAGGVNLPGVGLGQISIAETPTKVLCLTEVQLISEIQPFLCLPHVNRAF